MQKKRHRKQPLILKGLAVMLLAALAVPADAVAGNVEWKFNNILPEKRPETKIIQKFAALAGKNSDGRVNVKVFSGGSLGVKASDTLRWLPKGFPESGLIFPAFLGRDAPQLANIYPAGISASAEEHKRALPVVEGIIFDNLRKTGIEPLGTIRYTDTLVSVFCRDEPVTSLAQLRKKKIRVYSKHLVKTFSKLGISAIPIPQSELYVALKTGVVDCAFYNNSLVHTISMQEVVKFGNPLLRQGTPPMVLAASTKKWAALSAEDQKAVKSAAAAIRDDFIAITPRFTAYGKKKLAEGNVKIGAWFSDADRQAFADAALETWNATLSKLGEEATRNGKKIVVAIDR